MSDVADINYVYYVTTQHWIKSQFVELKPKSLTMGDLIANTVR